METISVITPTLDSANTLQDCIASVSHQAYRATHLVQDGGSRDKTAGMATESGCHVASEQDNGIYDAMNRGIGRLSNGIVGLLNADDFYASSTVLEKVADTFENKGVDACFGDLVYVREKGGGRRAEVGGLSGEETDAPSSTTLAPLHPCPPPFAVVRYWKAWAGKDQVLAPERVCHALRWGWMPPHPTLFVKHDVYERYGLFRTNHGTAADYEFMLRIFGKHKVRSAYISDVLVAMRVGGASNTSPVARARANMMDCRAWGLNGLKPYPWTCLAKPVRKLSQWLPLGPPCWRPGATMHRWWEPAAR